jgi:hypothetical protein
VFLSLNFVLNILLHMSVSLQFSFKNLSFKRNLSFKGHAERAKKFLVRVRVVQAHSSWHGAVSDPGGAGARAAPDERRPTGVRRARCLTRRLEKQGPGRAPGRWC